jgi:Zn finger protein HypA/HybF involved in hydrogenase expression
MLRCPACGNEDEFVVEEHLWQRSRIQCDTESYTFIEDVEFLVLEEWGEIECMSCSHRSDEQTMREGYFLAHGYDADGAPIPYTLVDASTT